MRHSVEFDDFDDAPGSPAKGLCRRMDGYGDSKFMEKLLLHCASALETGDITLSQQLMWVLNNYADSEGDCNQRLTHAFLKALVARATGNPLISEQQPPTLSVMDLAYSIDLTPWYRFGFCVANSAVYEAVRNYTSVHIVDFGVTHCMQYPTLIDILSKRPRGPPLVKLTVSVSTAFIPPVLNASYDELGLRLLNFARTRHVPFEFRVITGVENLLVHLRASRMLGGLKSEEALIVNCQMMLHYVPEETVQKTGFGLRDGFLSAVRELEPSLFILVDEDADLTSTELVDRMRSAMEYFWIPLDAIETVLPKACWQRDRYESDIRFKIENVVACEGLQRVERLETRSRWSERMRKALFRSFPASDDMFARAKSVLADHAAGWGVKREDDGLTLTWKGHNAVFATIWVPSPCY
ncbi:scarecrow-like protein 32 [Nymphaea colorata]|uniref:scarecrow-like protein 32 n=1 Tax=Nymphaea colorata TaxID=210225 RepID=UPI00129E2780|nr:scarecrow-like protein 32 [Nymphaea colorata]XP_031478509.1 scarecrow-like protein 32 [Nymphaea colorata]XP_031478510.1 scarecrow-like protein 32 [Nymphaea colorata]